ncbi:hypothetical protein CC78DRAFT_574319 [Lojkania enalia]|uniref:5'-3' DNA helicase ZGRF1-like N-terminal domain-containing protein n=1 Tax=Lojkania enalia TaxID=147567 RepID=A0A9P4TRB2_9PLEO|nr:hypothetical protein CC78DRAFT_574319 [Didymosphaeria enalia]
MTAPLRSSPRLAPVPASQNTAPVAEFRCLFTHDIRRKQKRWQDGFLKFHTFNSRVMVYDTSRNFLGDTYWKDNSELHEGDELTLDKGMLVEVADAMGVSQTDLTPLFEKRLRESPPGKGAAPLLRPLSRPAIPPTNALRSGSQLRHKSLNTLLGKPKGPIGKATPIKSPYEARKEKENEWAEGRATKRQRTDQAPFIVLSSSVSEVEQPIVPRDIPPTVKATGPKRPARPRPIPSAAAVINLQSEPDNISSDINLPSNSILENGPKKRPQDNPAPTSREINLGAIPVQATPKLPRGKLPLPQLKAKEIPQCPPRSSSPPVSASNRLSNVDFALKPATQGTSRKARSPTRSPPRDPKAKSLRLASGSRRGMLLCQTLPQQRAEPATADHQKPQKKLKKKPESKSESEVQAYDPVLWLSDVNNSLVDRRKEKSLAVIATKERIQHPSNTNTRRKKQAVALSPQSSSSAFEDMEIVHGLLDQQLIVSPDPPEFVEKAQWKSSQAPTVKTKTIAQKKALKQHLAKDDTPKIGPMVKVAKVRKEKEKLALVVSDVLAIPEPSSQDPPRVRYPRPQSAVSNTSSRKVVALSTGDLRKKSGKAEPPPAESHKQTAPNIQLQPLGANKNGPLMTTTELSLLLQKPQKPIRVEDDPIQDSQPTNVSPICSFRRVRSENDAPMSSMSTDWKKRDLPAEYEIAESLEIEKPSEKLKSGLAALVKMTDPRCRFQRVQSLNVDTNAAGAAAAGAVEIMSPPVDTDVGPWSTEAFDLFDWRPPVKEAEEAGIGMLVDNS